VKPPTAVTPASISRPPAAVTPSSTETPAQTYERVTGQKWTGGTSAPVAALLQKAGVSAPAGSAQANLALQNYLKNPPAASPTPTTTGTQTDPNAGTHTDNPTPTDPNAGKTPQDGTQTQPIDYATFLQNLLGSANTPFDYSTAATNAKNSYEAAFGTPASRAQPLTDAQNKLYEDAKTKALEDTKGDFASRGLYFSGGLDTALAGTGVNFANAQAAAAAQAQQPYQQQEGTGVLDLIKSAATAREDDRTRALSILPSLLMSQSAKNQIFGSPQTGYYSLDASGNPIQLTNGAQLTPAGLDLAATEFMRTGQMPALGNGSPQMKAQILERAAQMAKANGQDPNNVVAGWAGYSADKGSLAQIQQTADAVDAFERTAKSNLQTFLQKAQGMVDTGSPLANHVFRGAARVIQGSGAQAEADAARVVAFTEISKVLSSPAASSAVTDSARNEASSVISGDYTLPQIMAVAKVLMGDMDNRKASLAQQIQEINGRLGGGSSSPTPPTPSTPPATSGGGSPWSF
jgi:hypothetical protein